MCSKVQTSVVPPFSGYPLLLQCYHLLCTATHTGQAHSESFPQSPRVDQFSWSHSPNGCINLCDDKGQEQQSRHRILLGHRLDCRISLLSTECIFQVFFRKKQQRVALQMSGWTVDNWLLILSGLINSRQELKFLYESLKGTLYGIPQPTTEINIPGDFITP